MPFQNLKTAISVVANGGLVVVTDDDDRENEGDLVMAASHCSTEAMAFIIRHTSGIVCAPMSVQKADALGLSLMVQKNEDPLMTAFTVSVDAKVGTTTGISAQQRANTVATLASSQHAGDFVRPGHVFPLIAKGRGVLERAGHTEAAVDLCRLAGLGEVAVIAELMNPDGSVMKGHQITEFAVSNNLLKMSVAELIDYRLATERLTNYRDDGEITTKYGVARTLRFDNLYTDDVCIALSYHDINRPDALPALVYMEDSVQHIFDGRDALDVALRRISEDGGILIYMRLPQHRSASICHKKASERQREIRWRQEGFIHQVLSELGSAAQKRLFMGGKHQLPIAELESR